MSTLNSLHCAAFVNFFLFIILLVFLSSHVHRLTVHLAPFNYAFFGCWYSICFLCTFWISRELVTHLTLKLRGGLLEKRATCVLYYQLYNMWVGGTFAVLPLRSVKLYCMCFGANILFDYLNISFCATNIIHYMLIQHQHVPLQRFACLAFSFG